MASEISVNAVSSTGLLLDGITLSEPMLTYHEWGPGPFIWRHFNKIYLTHIICSSITKTSFKFTYLQFHPHLPGASELKILCVFTFVAACFWLLPCAIESFDGSRESWADISDSTIPHTVKDHPPYIYSMKCANSLVLFCFAEVVLAELLTSCDLFTHIRHFHWSNCMTAPGPVMKPRRIWIRLTIN